MDQCGSDYSLSIVNKLYKKIMSVEEKRTTINLLVSEFS